MTEKKRGRPATGQTPNRSVRIPDGRWKAVKDLAAEEGKTASDVINEAVEGHLRRKGKKG